MPDSLGAGSMLWPLLSDLAALSVGGFVTYIDCSAVSTARVGRLPETFKWNPFVIRLVLVCGLIAAVACQFFSTDPTGVISTILTWKLTDPNSPIPGVALRQAHRC